MYGSLPTEFKMVETKTGKKEVSSLVVFKVDGDVLVGEKGERQMSHKGSVPIKYPMTLNGITRELNDANKKKRTIEVMREEDYITVGEESPLKLLAGNLTISYGFLISSLLDEVIELADGKTAKMSGDFPNVISIPSFYQPKQIETLSLGVNALSDQEEFVLKSDPDMKEQNEKDEGKTGDEMLKEFIDDMNDDKETPKEKTVKVPKKTKGKKKKIKKTKKTDNLKKRVLDKLTQKEEGKETENTSKIPDQKEAAKALQSVTTFAPNHILHALEYYAIEDIKETKKNQTVVVVEFGASYFRATKFRVKGKEIEMIQHETSFLINTRKLNQMVLILILKKFENRQQVIEKINTMTPAQEAALWKTVDAFRVQLSANERVITEFMEKPIVLVRSEFEELIKSDIDDIVKLLMPMREGVDAVYLTGGLGYTPIISKKVEEVFGKVSRKMTKLLEGMRLYGMMHPINGVLTSASPLPLIHDILPFGFYVKVGGSDVQIFEKNYKLPDDNVESVEIEMNGNKDIQLCMYTPGKTEYDVDNCFDDYEVEGNVMLEIVPLSMGLVKSVKAEKVKKVGDKKEDVAVLIKNKRSRDKSMELIVQKRMEYQKLLMNIKDDPNIVQEDEVYDSILKELDEVENGEDIALIDLEKKIKVAKKMWDDLKSGKKDEVKKYDNDEPNGANEDEEEKQKQNLEEHEEDPKADDVTPEEEKKPETGGEENQKEEEEEVEVPKKPKHKNSKTNDQKEKKKRRDEILKLRETFKEKLKENKEKATTHPPEEIGVEDKTKQNLVETVREKGGAQESVTMKEKVEHLKARVDAYTSIRKVRGGPELSVLLSNALEKASRGALMESDFKELEESVKSFLTNYTYYFGFTEKKKTVITVCGVLILIWFVVMVVVVMRRKHTDEPIEMESLRDR
ncbi:hypothetical protein EIN_026820 [Entamoeba invadens IP1]|uniref:hypothetical protein n=1 Tax=Entamoeba invadens IP1 TaxID=370355 RepID=UPI0002C3E943|nr:hypothetical protein EIN_026820 [Entamoeba invadens IP1]ELP90803.1 hypothetical protein EIN_026820 [Entamoeba invadens IP1]|eukprot:XP_004257574.1 hypothetical protein EIN_026820 [Entamoeba invadens IP1]